MKTTTIAQFALIAGSLCSLGFGGYLGTKSLIPMIKSCETIRQEPPTTYKSPTLESVSRDKAEALYETGRLALSISLIVIGGTELGVAMAFGRRRPASYDLM